MLLRRGARGRPRTTTAMSPEAKVRATWKPSRCQAQLLPMAFLSRSPHSGSRLAPSRAHVLPSNQSLTLIASGGRSCLAVTHCVREQYHLQVYILPGSHSAALQLVITLQDMLPAR